MIREEVLGVNDDDTLRLNERFAVFLEDRRRLHDAAEVRKRVKCKSPYTKNQDFRERFCSPNRPIRS